MSVRVQWSPNSEGDMSLYLLQSGPTAAGPWTQITSIVHDFTGPNYDGTYFFYVDVAGSLSTFYTVIAVDTLGNQSAPSPPFQPGTPPPDELSAVKIDSDYGSPGALTYRTQSGHPIEAAIIRVYLKTDFDLGNTQNPIAITQTTEHGRWVNPLYLTTGYTYVVQFAKPGLYGPDNVSIVV